jgi:cell division protein FtsZ
MGIIDSDMDALKYELQEDARKGARIKVIGVGGGGANAVTRMVTEGLQGVEFYVINTDSQALAAAKVPNKLQIGAKITNGLGAGASPEIGRQAALENTDQIIELLHGADLVFVTAGLGGGTGTGAAPVVASLAKELDALTIAVVTKPFRFEGVPRMRIADQGLSKLAATVDTVISIPNDRLLSLAPRGTSFVDAFKLADDLLRQAVQGISDIILTPGLINRDFADIRSTMLGMGYAMMGTATARGENAAVEAARQAISSPLLEDSRITGSRGILINITGSSTLGLHEVNEACEIIRAAADTEDVQINFGVIVNEAMGDAVKVTVIATGFQPDNAPPPERKRVEVRMPVFLPEPVREPEPPPVYEPEPAPVMAETVPEPPPVAFDPEDLDTPAYLRQGRLLN